MLVYVVKAHVYTKKGAHNTHQDLLNWGFHSLRLWDILWDAREMHFGIAQDLL